MLLNAALAYSRKPLLFRIFVVSPDDCRTPLVGCDRDEAGEKIAGTGGVRKATRDRDVIRRWFAEHPNAQIALACGEPSDVDVLDVDVKGEDGPGTLARLEAEYGRLPTTWRARTPSGGLHVYFAHARRETLRNRVGFLPGLDIRTTGGSVCLPPSRKPTGQYVWIDRPSTTPLADWPDWLLALADPPVPPRSPAPPIRWDTTDRLARYVSAAVDREAGALARMGPNTGRNLALFQASANLAELVAAGVLPQAVAEDALERAAADNGLIREDGLHAVKATIRSGFSRGLQNPRQIEAA